MKRSNFFLALVAIVVALGIVSWSGAVRAKPAEMHVPSSTNKNALSTLVSVEAQPESVLAGQTFAIVVRVDGLDANLSSFQVDLDYDPTVIDFVSSLPGDLLESTGRNVFCPPTARNKSRRAYARLVQPVVMHPALPVMAH